MNVFQCCTLCFSIGLSIINCARSHTHTDLRCSCGEQMMDRIDVTHVVLSGEWVKNEEVSWTSADISDTEAESSGNEPLILWDSTGSTSIHSCDTYTASVCSELRNRPCSRFSRTTSELKVKTETSTGHPTSLFQWHADGRQCVNINILTSPPQNKGHRRGSGMRSLVQTLEYVSCSSGRAGSGTPRSGRSAKTPTAGSRWKRNDAFESMCCQKRWKSQFGLTYMEIN